MANEEKSGFLYTTTTSMTKFREVLKGIKSETHIHNLHTTRLLLERLVDGTVDFLGGLRMGLPKINGAQQSVSGTPATSSVEGDDEDDAGSEGAVAKPVTVTASAADMKNPAVVAAMEALRKAGVSAEITEPKFPTTL